MAENCPTEREKEKRESECCLFLCVVSFSLVVCRRAKFCATVQCRRAGFGICLAHTPERDESSESERVRERGVRFSRQNNSLEFGTWELLLVAVGISLGGEVPNTVRFVDGRVCVQGA